MNYSDEEKIKRLLDAQEHPEHYTDEELCEIIRDARPLARLKRALMEARTEDEDINVEKAWKAFSLSHPDSSRSNEKRLPVACHPWSLTPPPSPPIIAFPAGCVWQLSSSAVSSLPVWPLPP